MAAFLRKLKRRRENHLGIDIGAHVLKVVELKVTAAGAELRHCAAKPIKPGGREVSALAAQLSELLQEHDIKTRRAVVGVGGAEVAVRRLSLPPIPRGEIVGAIRWQARKLFPFPMEDALVAYHLLPGGEGQGREKLEVLAVAVTREAVMQKVAVLRESGLQCVGVLAEPHAMLQLWLASGLADERTGSQAIVDLGATKTGIHIFEGGLLAFSRDVATGGESLTEALTGTLRAGEHQVAVNEAQAELIKREYGIPAIADERVTEEGIPLSQLGMRMRPALEKLEVGISQSLDYYGYQFGGAPASRLLLAGGGNQLKGIESFFSEWFDSEVQILEPATALGHRQAGEELEQQTSGLSALALAAGLALPLDPQFNLLPPELQYQRQWRPPPQAAYAALALLFLLPLAQYTWQAEKRLDAFRRAAALKQSRLQSYGGVLEQYERLQQESRELDLRLASLPDIDSRTVPLAEAMGWISRTIPEEMVLTRMEVLSGEKGGAYRLRLQGLVFGSKNGSFSLLTRFMERLEKAPAFSWVEIGSIGESSTPEPATLGFEIACVFR